jgi:pimeloyl-ACP methyl ester carboxylesterase
MVVVPDLPGLKSGEITPETVSGTIEVAQALPKQPDTRDGQVGLIGVSTGAALALLAAEDPSLKGHVSTVSGVAPYSDCRTILNIATTGYYRDGETLVPYKADPYLSYVVARSGVAMLSPGKDQQKLESELNEVGRLDPDPLAGLRNRSLEDLGPEARSVVALLANEDPERFDELYKALPDEIRAKLERISPLSGEGQIEAPVELVSGLRDKYFPISESYAVARIAPNLRVTVTGALDHAELSFSLGDIPGFLRMDGFVVQSIRQTRSASSPG